jgi:hypothetical protein
VCYNQADAPWVLKELRSQLEQRKKPPFRLSLYERDMLGGQDKVNYILDMMAKSRKVLLIVTNAFAANQWCQLELTMAQHKVVDTDSDNVILALMEDILPINLNPRLALLLRRKGRLRWTDHPDGQRLFWKKLVGELKARNESFAWSALETQEASSLLRTLDSN